MNILQRINEVRKEIVYIKKDKTVSTGASGSYKAVTHDQVTAMVREHMVKHGIVSYPVFVEGISQPKEVDKEMNTAKQFRYESVYDIHFCNIDDPNDKITLRVQAHAMDNADKACGKALSYAKKYAVLKLFEIETGEDEESRYQEKDTFDLEFWCDGLRNCTSVSELEKTYLEAKALAVKASDAPSMKILNRVTSEIKAKLEVAK